MIIAPLKDYWNLITSAYKVAFLTFLVLTIAGYIGYLNIKLTIAQRNAAYYKSAAESYKANAENLKDRLGLEQSSHRHTIDYYESLECIERKKGPLTDEELTGRKSSTTNPVKKEIPKDPKKKPSWFNLF